MPTPSECVRSSTTQISEKIRTYSRSRSSKVIDLGANRKRICNFLLVVNSTVTLVVGLSRTVFRDIDADIERITKFGLHLPKLL